LYDGLQESQQLIYALEDNRATLHKKA